MDKNISLEEFSKWLEEPETHHLEFKTAKNGIDSRKLLDYCAGLSNEGGGRLILGVSPSGEVVGTCAHQGTINKLPHELYTKIGIRIDIQELKHPEGRVLIFSVPSRSRGQVVQSKGHYRYPMRTGDSLIEMDADTLKNILNETDPDFSGQTVKGFAIDDLDDEAIDNFRQKWSQKAGREEYINFSKDKILRASGLMNNKGLTYASLILFGKKVKIDELLPASEIIFEWRQKTDAIPYDFRKSWREPFFKIHDEIWKAINDRNLRFPFQEGLFQREILAFNEKSIREALLNAIAHRDYTIKGQSIFIKASPQEFAIESPGGLPSGVTPENILVKTCWRNRCIAEAFEKVGFAERSGQGMDDIFDNSIREGKGLPDLSRSDLASVILRLPAQVQDKNFIIFLERLQSEKGIVFSFEEIYELEHIREKQIVVNPEFKKKFLSLGIIEQIGKTRGAKYILSHKYYTFQKKAGVHTRLSGITREKQKEFILQHLSKNKSAKRTELQDIFPELKPMDVSNLLQELKRMGKIIYEGAAKNGFWKLAK